MNAQRISRIQLVCADATATVRFYEAAFGFGCISESEIDSGRAVTLRLGGQSIELAELQPRGRPYPAGVCGANLLFQHFAIVVADMPSAYAHLRAQGGWTAISTDGPQRLPTASGGVTAFKFRDPEGHPLELLAFPEHSMPSKWRSQPGRPFLGIDHSALSVADTARSVAFYGGLGLTVLHRSHNVGPEQDRLDGMSAAQVDVTALVPPASSTPHIELLCYRGPRPASTPPAPNDIAATRLVFAVEGTEVLDTLCRRWPCALVATSRAFDDCTLHVLLRDPDGHLLLLQTPIP
jgi:catechol 2,3-dioxygenase-like lactoylglutathione lyase family enzyme